MWKIKGDGDLDTHYIQIHDIDKEPSWLPMSQFLEIAFSQYLSNEKFIDQSLKMYEHNAHSPLETINRIIKV